MGILGNQYLIAGVESDSQVIPYRFGVWQKAFGEIIPKSVNGTTKPFEISELVNGPILFLQYHQLKETILFLWIEGPDQTRSDLFAQTFDLFGNKVGPTITISSEDGIGNTFPVIIPLDTSFAILWERREAVGGLGSSKIKGAEIGSTGSLLKKDLPIYTTLGFNQQMESVIPLKSGFLSTWQLYVAQDGSSYDLKGQIFDNYFNRVGSEFTISTQSDGIQAQLVHASTSGFLFTAWESAGSDGNGYGIAGQIFDENGNKSGGEFQIHTTIIGNQIEPKLASNRDTVLAIWETRISDTTSNLWGQLFANSGTKIGKELKLASGIEIEVWSSNIFSLDTGFVVTWRGIDNPLNGNYLQIFDRKGFPMANIFKFPNGFGAEVLLRVSAFPAQQNQFFANLLLADSTGGLKTGIYLYSVGTPTTLLPKVDKKQALKVIYQSLTNTLVFKNNQIINGRHAHFQLFNSKGKQLAGLKTNGIQSIWQLNQPLPAGIFLLRIISKNSESLAKFAIP